MGDNMTLSQHSAFDDDLLARAIKGDAEAFGDLYERHMMSIYRYVYYRIGEVREAEDLTETIFVKAWQALPNFRRSKASFKTWLYRVAHNLLVDYYRTLKVELELPEDSLLQSPSPQPEEQVIAMEQSEQIGKAIRKLNPQHQEVLTLRFINDMSHEETGEVMGKSAGAVRVLQHRALKALREQFEKSGGLP
jgi:RNA polymerase sigma-70 factor (ECF subfamily)